MRRPRASWCGAPIFLSGNFAPCDPDAWNLDVREGLLLPQDLQWRVLGIDDRGPIMEARLCRYGREGDGMAVSLGAGTVFNLRACGAA